MVRWLGAAADDGFCAGVETAFDEGAGAGEDFSPSGDAADEGRELADF